MIKGSKQKGKLWIRTVGGKEGSVVSGKDCTIMLVIKEGKTRRQRMEKWKRESRWQGRKSGVIMQA